MIFVAEAGAALPVLAVAFVAAALLALVLTPLVRDVATRRGVVDLPDERRVHTQPIPRAGGLAIAAAYLVVALGIVLVTPLFGDPLDVAALHGPDLAALLLGGAVATLLGYLDDRYQLRARWQLAGQLLVAFIAIAVGIRIGIIANPVGPGSIQFVEPFAAGFTIFWIVGMINSVNFIDGLDGLSAGIAFIAAMTLGALSLTTTVGQPAVAGLCVALAGALLGFLRWNFHPASVFAGTAGTMFVGYTLAILAILGTAKVAVALLVLGVPILDTFWTFVRRVATGRSPFTPDRGHLHHRLLDLGLSHRQTVLLIYAICTGLGILSLVTSALGQLYAFLGVLVASGLVLFLLTRGRFAKEALEAESYDPDDDTTARADARDERGEARAAGSGLAAADSDGSG